MRSNPRKSPRRGRRQARNLSLLVLFVIALAVLIIISPNEPTKSALGLARQMARRQHLEGHLAPRLCLFGAIDDAHGARAEPVEKAVRADLA